MKQLRNSPHPPEERHEIMNAAAAAAAVSFDARAPSLFTARTRAAAACAAFNAIPEDAPAETRVHAWWDIVDPARQREGKTGSEGKSEDEKEEKRGEGDQPERVTAESPLIRGDGRGPRPMAPFVRPPVWIDYGLRVRIAATALVDRGCTILDAPVADVRIGEYATVGPGVNICAVTHPRAGGRASLGAAVVIEEGAWIGAGSILLPGVTVGRHAVVGPGSVVTADVPARHVAAGNPAQVVRRLPDLTELEPAAEAARRHEAEAVTSLADALAAGTDGTSDEERRRTSEVVECVEQWARERRAMWRREGGAGGYPE